MSQLEKILINVDGKDYQVDAGQNIIDACAQINIEIPHFCYHPSLSIAGSCRLCLVQTGMPAIDRNTKEILRNSDGSMQIAWAPKPAIACGTNVCNNLHVVTNNELVKSCRAGALEFFLANHPLDCPICDCAGECKLQEYANAYGTGVSRYVEEKNVKPKLTEIANKIYLDNERCVLCSRCIRTCREVLKKDYLSFTSRGSRTLVCPDKTADIDSNYIMNIIDNCPVGALTSKDFRFKMRTWFLKTTNSISTESSAGVNTKVWSRENKIYRITPRQNNLINDNWMTDSGRMEYKKYDDSVKIKYARIDGSPCEPLYAIGRAGEILKLGSIAIIASARQTLEEQYLVAQLAKECSAQIFVPAHLGEDDGFLLSSDRTPNMRGAFLTGLVKEYPKTDLLDLKSKVLSGEVKSILSFGEDLLGLGFDSKDLKNVNVIYCAVSENELSQLAKITLPVCGDFEKSGIYINRQWRAQKFDAVYAPCKNILTSVNLIFNLLKMVKGEDYVNPSHAEVVKIISQEMNVNFDKMNSSGILIDSSKFSSVKFPELKALHYDA